LTADRLSRCQVPSGSCYEPERAEKTERQRSDDHKKDHLTVVDGVSIPVDDLGNKKHNQRDSQTDNEIMDQRLSRKAESRVRVKGWKM
jgi:hypothetical protein